MENCDYDEMPAKGGRKAAATSKKKGRKGKGKKARRKRAAAK